MRKLSVWIDHHRVSPVATFAVVVVLPLALASLAVGQGIGSLRHLSSPSVVPSTTAGTPPRSFAGQGVAFGIQGVENGPFRRTYRVPLGGSFRGFLQLTNHQTAQAFLLTCLLNYQQVPLDGQGRQVAFGMVAAGAQGVMSGQVKAPTATGVHELMVLWVENPYHALEYPSDGPERQLAKAPLRRVALVVATP